jgi:putative two-component system response regulator
VEATTLLNKETALMPIESNALKLYEEEFGSPADPLTGLYNYGIFQAFLEEECRRCDRYGTGFSLAFFNIEGLGRVSAERGPLYGERIIRKTGDIISKCKRTADLAARCSDNRFAVLYPYTKAVDAGISAERVCAAMAGEDNSATTISAGIAGYPLHASNWQGLIDRAREALVEAKLRGSNKVVVCEIEPFPEASDTPRILIVDDDHQNLKLLEALLRREKYEVSRATNGMEALALLQEAPFDLVVSDVMMPCMDGFELCRRIKQSPATRMLPVIMMTALDDTNSKVKAIDSGADDFMNKPPNRMELAARVRSLVKLRRVTSKMTTIHNVIFSLAGAVEAKDGYTQGHIDRVAKLASSIGRRMGLSEGEVEALKLGGALHDIGKIAVPDNILNKPGALSPEERTVMESHTEVGHRICYPLKENLGLALDVVRHHHEKLDGSGYPDRLKGVQIPQVARIVAVVDIFDALVTDRPYRKGMPREAALGILFEEVNRGKIDGRAVEHLKRFLDGVNHSAADNSHHPGDCELNPQIP